MIYLDSETLSLTGPIIILQYAVDDGPIHVVDFWKQKIYQTIELLETIINHDGGVCIFNAAFDWFHVQKMYNTLVLMNRKEKILIDCIEEFYNNEEKAIWGKCCKPKHVLDLMLYARKTSYQSTMSRRPIKIKKVPTVLALQLKQELENRVQFNPILFAKTKEKGWNIQDTEDPNFKNLILQFAPSSGLKALAADALKIKDTRYFNEINRLPFPKEVAYKPWGGNWKPFLHEHVNHWLHNEEARKYAANDVYYLRELHRYFKNLDPNLQIDDDDSVLACAVAAIRVRGYSLNLDLIEKKRDKLVKKIKVGEFDPEHVPTAPHLVKKYLLEVMGDEERLVFNLSNSTKKQVLKDIAEGNKWEGTPASERARKVIETRDAKYKIQVFSKLLDAKRIHPTLNVIGTLSGRMSSGSKQSSGRKIKDLNFQGFARDSDTRECFTIADEGFILEGGDFDAFEVTLADAVYNDHNLRNDLTRCFKCNYNYKFHELLLKHCPQCNVKDGRKKIHGLFGVEMYPGHSYEDILNTRGTKNDLYSLSKNGVFTVIYQGTPETLVFKYNVERETAVRALNGFLSKYPGIVKAQQETKDKFCSMRQPNGIGSRVIWNDPAEYEESLLGFKRYFNLENSICKALYDLANSPPPSWKKLEGKIVRRDRAQTFSGAVQSSLYAAAFAIQSGVMRQAGNHRIQSAGAEITKHVQRKIWDLQPSGIHDWVVMPCNIHDEILCPVSISMNNNDNNNKDNNIDTNKVKEVVNNTVESYRSKVPLIAMNWKTGIKSWAEK